MSLVWSCNEWDPLEEVIVGNPLRARFPAPDVSTQLAEFPDRSLEEIPQGPFPQRIIEETEEDLNAFISVLEDLGITVERPETWPHEARFSTIHWESQGFYNYCPRDVMLVIGDHIIESPNVMGGAVIEPKTTLLPLSMVLKEMHVPTATYEGSPAEPVSEAQHSSPSSLGHDRAEDAPGCPGRQLETQRGGQMILTDSDERR